MDERKATSGHPGFLVLAAFEYSSACGDLLIYGLEPERAGQLRAGWPPERAADQAQALGGVCVVAHPTRAGPSFDERLGTMGLAAMEV